MVSGVRFAADAPVRTVLHAVLPIFPAADVDFLVREYWVCTVGKGLPERRFTPQELQAAVNALTADEHAELFTIYALPHDAPDTPMKMPEAQDDTEEAAQECVTCFCEFLAKCASADDQSCPVTIAVSVHELPTVSVQTASGEKVIFNDLYASRLMDEDTRERFRELEALWGENSEDDLFITKFCEKLKASLPVIFASTIEIKPNL